LRVPLDPLIQPRKQSGVIIFQGVERVSRPRLVTVVPLEGMLKLGNESVEEVEATSAEESIERHAVRSLERVTVLVNALFAYERCAVGDFRVGQKPMHLPGFGRKEI